MESFIERFACAESTEELQTLSQELANHGYTFISRWITRMEKELEEAGEKQLTGFSRIIEKAEQILPQPGLYSPSWANVWTDLYKMIEIKQKVYDRIPEDERSGEWQLLFDNPHSTDGMVAHVNLNFSKAAFLFAKYRKDLNKLEYLSLQRVQRFITEFGE